MHNSANGSYDIYDITRWKQGSCTIQSQGTIKTAELAVEGDKINFNNTTLGNCSHSVVTNGTDIVVAGVSGNKLQTITEHLKMILMSM